jgi:hypothetical protein
MICPSDTTTTKGKTMKKVYRLAKRDSESSYDYQPKQFGPVMTLDQAQAYQEDLRLGGFDVLVINTQEGM